ncbi:MAG: heparinase II/III family protein [Alphaproteobacteria bacterium]|nr:heparinase II/III family protein [Alphaproteobacteria bacterium]
MRQHVINSLTHLNPLRLGRSTPISDRLVVRPVDSRPGCAETGAALLNGAQGLEPEYWHRCLWLRDMRACSDDDARQSARQMILHWIEQHGREDRFAWRADFIGARLTQWLSHHDFFTGSDESDFDEKFFASVDEHIRHLDKIIPGGLYGIPVLEALQGLIYAGLTLEGWENIIPRALAMFSDEINRQILPDGLHISRSPGQLQQALQILMDCRTLMALAGYPQPLILQRAAERMGLGLRLFRMPDRALGTLQGTAEGNPDIIEALLAQAAPATKTIESLKQSGFERVSRGRSVLLIDRGDAPPKPYLGHAAPLSFEFFCGKHRLFVSCGTHTASADWQEILRASAAHNMVVVDNRSAHPHKIVLERQDNARHTVLEGHHDGYSSLKNLIVQRQLVLSADGNRLQGQELLSSARKPSQAVPLAVRFHLHPRVIASIIRSGAAALLRLPDGSGWRFTPQSSQDLSLQIEESIYLGDGKTPRKTQQLVIHSALEEKDAHILWSLTREGLSDTPAKRVQTRQTLL